MATVERIKRGPTLREQRAMGISFVNLSRIMRDMKGDGLLAGETGSSLASVVLDRLITEDPATFDPKCEAIDWGAIDWDKVMEIIQRLIDLILKFMAIFAAI